VPAYYKCGGWDYTKPWDGCTVCEKGSTCVEQNGMWTLRRSSATKLIFARMVFPVRAKRCHCSGVMRWVGFHTRLDRWYSRCLRVYICPGIFRKEISSVSVPNVNQDTSRSSLTFAPLALSFCRSECAHHVLEAILQSSFSTMR